MVWFYGISTRLFIAKSFLYIYIKYIGFCLVEFYGISTIIGYSMPNPSYTIYMYIYIYIYMYSVPIYLSQSFPINKIIYIYIYIERERVRERKWGRRERERERLRNELFFFFNKNVVIRTVSLSLSVTICFALWFVTKQHVKKIFDVLEVASMWNLRNLIEKTKIPAPRKKKVLTKKK